MQTSQTAAKVSSDVYPGRPAVHFSALIHECDADELTYGGLILTDLDHACSARDLAIHPCIRLIELVEYNFVRCC